MNAAQSDRVISRLDRIAVALERLASNREPQKQSGSVTSGELSFQTHTLNLKPRDADHNAASLVLADKLDGWLRAEDTPTSFEILTDAIMQSTGPHTVEWLAAIAERYGFKP